MPVAKLKAGKGQRRRKGHLRPLSEVELAFVRAWRGENKEAAIAAGFPEAHASQRGYDLMNRPEVAGAIRAKQEAILFSMGQHEAEQLAEHGITLSFFFQELKRVAEQKRQHSKRGFADKNEALRMIGEIFGKFKKEPKVTMGIERGTKGGVPYEAAWVTRQCAIANDASNPAPEPISPPLLRGGGEDDPADGEVEAGE